MNAVQSKIVDDFRENLSPERRLTAQTDAQIARMMFVNYSTHDRGRGMRLTKFGLKFMLEMFQAVDISLPEEHRLQSRELLFLDKRATMPYYLSDRRLVVFEIDLGIMLRLVDGNIGTLIEAEGGTGG